MKNLHEMQLIKDTVNRKITVTRKFSAPPEVVWRAWTERELLDQWWAPEPWRAETKFMDFREGGHWLYAMVGPDNSRHWARADFFDIIPFKGYSGKDSFCDENGNVNKDLPVSIWKNEFHPAPEGTQVIVEMTFQDLADLEKILEMGFEEGFASAMGSLDHYLSIQFYLRKEMKTSRKARATTYLNFPGKTEEAFNFYKKVFGGQFTGRGLRRFGDIEMPEGTPPMSEEDKKLIIHAELEILGGHVLMATDAPESMGFKMIHGNNMHINLEPETREETQRLFHALSEGGSITMPLEDMFWGAYFGAFTDRYGINWMLHFQTNI